MLSKETQEYREYTHNCSMLNCRKYPKYDTGCNVQQIKQISGWIALFFFIYSYLQKYEFKRVSAIYI